MYVALFRRMVYGGYKKRQPSSVTGRRYARYRSGRGAEVGSGNAIDVSDNPLLHVDYAADYQRTSSWSCEDSVYSTFTPTKGEQVSAEDFSSVSNS